MSVLRNLAQRQQRQQRRLADSTDIQVTTVSDTQINVLNDALNRVISDIQLSNPPRLVLYKDFTVDFHMEHGRIRTEPAVLALGGVQIFASNFVDVEGQVKVHLAPVGERVLLRDLIDMLRW